MLTIDTWEHVSCPFIHSTNLYWRPALCQTSEVLEIQWRISQTCSSLCGACALVGEERHWAIITRYDVLVGVGKCRILQGRARKIWLGLSYGVRVLPDRSPQTWRKISGNPRPLFCSFSSLLCIVPLSILSCFHLLKVWKRKLTQEPFENVDEWVMYSAEIIRTGRC